MKIQCPSCLLEGTFPDEKVPSGGVTVSCPKCKNKFKIGSTQMEERNPSSELKTEWEYYGEDISDTRKHEYIQMAAMLSKDAEWLLEKMPMTFEWRLDALGSERWELVSATFIPIGEYKSFWKMIFKRPKLQEEKTVD